MIMLLLGSSGVGKSTVKSYLESDFGFESAQKYTTRSHRGTAEEDRDFIFCNESEIPDNGVLRFSSYGAIFAIQLAKIDESLSRGQSHVLTVGGPTTVRALATRYPSLVNTVLLYCDVHVLRRRICGQSDDSARSNRWPAIQAEVGLIYDWLGCVNHVIDCSGPFSATALQIDRLLRQTAGHRHD